MANPQEDAGPEAREGFKSKEDENYRLAEEMESRVV